MLLKDYIKFDIEVFDVLNWVVVIFVFLSIFYVLYEVYLQRVFLEGYWWCVFVKVYCR